MIKLLFHFENTGIKVHSVEENKKMLIHLVSNYLKKTCLTLTLLSYTENKAFDIYILCKLVTSWLHIM